MYLFGANAAISGCLLSQSIATLFRARYDRKYRICGWNFDAICRSFEDINIFGFGDHIAISGCHNFFFM